jgi:hypothetical protein
MLRPAFLHSTDHITGEKVANVSDSSSHLCPFLPFDSLSFSLDHFSLSPFDSPSLNNMAGTFDATAVAKAEELALLSFTSDDAFTLGSAIRSRIQQLPTEKRRAAIIDIQSAHGQQLFFATSGEGSQVRLSLFLPSVPWNQADLSRYRSTTRTGRSARERRC